MKRTAIILVICLFALAVTPLTAFAHGHGRSYAAVQYALCSVENCNIAGTHYHGETCYYGHYVGDGHDYHQLCNVRGCVLAGVHEHDGTAYFCHNTGDSRNYHNSGHHVGLR